MDSKLLLTIHIISINIFILIYLVKTILLFTNKRKLDGFAQKIKIPEMIVSTLFLLTGIWLYAVLGAIKSLQIIKLALVVMAIPLAVNGFKKHRKVQALLSMLLIIGAYGISEASRNKPYLPGKVNITGNVVAANVEGLQGYLSHCAMCHGADGTKEYRGAALLSTSTMDESKAAVLIASGVKNGTRGTMPPFEGLLSESRIKSIATYIQGLKN